jgi:hypothetical protein
MINKISILAVFIILITLFSGCGGGSGSSGDGDKAVTNPEILSLLDDFAKVVDAYEVEGMLECLDDSDGFTLTIHEGSYTDTKNYTRLKTELTEDDEQNIQQTWRKTPLDGGNGYVLELIRGTATSGNESPSGAVVKQTFEVYESAVSPEIPRTKTDSGNMVWTLAKTTGEWKATAMVINYNTSSVNSSTLVVKTDGFTKARGFGFGGKIGL